MAVVVVVVVVLVVVVVVVVVVLETVATQLTGLVMRRACCGAGHYPREFGMHIY
jgi:hypothetical protein